MPLSEHEQKILAQLEESLSKQDPRFAKSVRETNIYAHSLRQIRWSAVAFVIGLVVLVAFFSQILRRGWGNVFLCSLACVRLRTR